MSFKRLLSLSYAISKQLLAASATRGRPLGSNTSLNKSYQLVLEAGRRAYATKGDGTNPWVLQDGIYEQKTSDVRRKERRQLLAQALGPMSQHDVHAKNLLQQGAKPWDVLRDGIAKGTGTLHLVRLCLESQYSKVKALSRSKRAPLLEAQREDSMALTTLRFLWTDEKLWVPFVLNDMNTQYILCYYVIVEGLEEVILQWLFLDINTPVSEVRQQNEWRGILLRSLIGAHTTHNSSRSADGSIKLFFEAVAMRYGKHHGMNLSLWPASLELSMHLTNLDSHLTRTDPELYDQFARFISDHPMHRSVADINNLTSRLALCHPRAPSAEIAIRILLEYDAYGVDDGTILPKLSNSKMQQAFSQLILRTIAVATSNGQLEAVAWIQQRFPKESAP